MPAVVWKEGRLFMAKTLSLELASQGKTQKEALANLQEAVDLFFENEPVKIPSVCIPQNPAISHIYA